jgi:hypothetical protein
MAKYRCDKCGRIFVECAEIGYTEYHGASVVTDFVSPCCHAQYTEVDDDIPYVKYGEEAMSIVDTILSAVYEARPEIAPVDEKSVLYGDAYYTVESIINDVIRGCIDEAMHEE